MSLVWFCKNCNSKEPVDSTGDPDQEYEEGDSEPCIDCGSVCRVYNEADLDLSPRRKVTRNNKFRRRRSSRR